MSFIQWEKRLSLVLAAAVATSFAAVGCGSSSEAGPLKKPQFVQQANAICSNAEGEREKAMREAAAGSDELEPAEFVTEVALPPIQNMTEELGDLGPPVGDEKEVKAIIVAFERGIRQVEADPTDLTSDVDAFADASKLAEEYGLTDCRI